MEGSSLGPVFFSSIHSHVCSPMKKSRRQLSTVIGKVFITLYRLMLQDKDYLKGSYPSGVRVDERAYV